MDNATRPFPKRPGHTARLFDRLPGADEVRSLLAELAVKPCSFKPVQADKPLALYGGGNMGRLAREFLNAVGHDFVAVIDRNAEGLSKVPNWTGVQFYKPESVPDEIKENARVAVSVAMSSFVSLEQTLYEMGFVDVVPFYDLAESFRHRHPLSNGWFAPPLTADDEKYAAEVLEYWADDVSRAHHLQFLAWRRLREEWQFEPAPVQIGDRYFIDEITSLLGQNEVFLDVGAHSGSVISTFMNVVNSSFQKIIAIEADLLNVAKLRRTIQENLNDDGRISVITETLGEYEGEVTFHGGLGYASQISATGSDVVRGRTLDSLDLHPSFIKLHLEGSELAVLKGGRQTLLENRPLIAATVYHNADGIWKTAHWLKDTLPGYRLLFRAHAWCGTGAVVYAIPDEKA